MFFRRERPHDTTFEERTESVKQLGFDERKDGADRVFVQRGPFAALVAGAPPGKPPRVEMAGLKVGDGIGLLVNGGYQMFFATPGGKRVPATADQLKGLHQFHEDLAEGLGLISLYNEGLGTISDLHLYDRVEHRDEGQPTPWQKKAG
jgi:hypothetical protein